MNDKDDSILAPFGRMFDEPHGKYVMMVIVILFVTLQFLGD